MHGGNDPYWKLRPQPSTPTDELCKCPDSPPIVVQDHLSSVPLACIRCNGEIPPESIGFSEALAEKLAFWRNVHRALMTLWLESGDYESWARARLEDPAGSVNVDGLAIVSELKEHRPAFYWWFEDNTAMDYTPATKCPRCASRLIEQFGRAVCQTCSIVVPGHEAG